MGMVDFASVHAVIDATQRKCVKYEDKCANIGYGFLPFSFSSFEELEKGESALLLGTKPGLFLDYLRADVTGTIIVMIGRVWDVIECRSQFSASKGRRDIFSKKITVKPNNEEYRVIKDDNFMLEFDGSTTFRKVSVKADGFVRYPLKLVDLNVIEPADNKYLIGRTNHLKSGSKNLDFHLANHRQRAVNQINAMGKPLGDNVYLSSTSSTVIFNDVEIPTIKVLKDANSDMELKNPYMPIDLTRMMKGTIENLLMYRLELDVSDDTTQTVVIMFDKTATALVGCSAGSLIDIKDEFADDHVSLPPSISNVIGTIQTMEIKSHSYYEYGTFDSFTCWQLNSKEGGWCMLHPLPPPLNLHNLKEHKSLVIEDSDDEASGDSFGELIDHVSPMMETLAEGEEGAFHLGLKRPRVYSNLSPEDKERFVIAVKLNRGLKESNYDQLYAYLKQHEAHANKNKMMLERFTQHTIDPLALMSNVSPHHACGQDNAVDVDLDEPPTMFIANLSSAYPVYDKACPSYDLNILSEVCDHDNYQDAICEHHEVHRMHNDVQPNCVVDSDAEYTSDSNMISYDQYVKDNAEPVVQNNVSFVPHDASMMIINEMHEQTAQCVYVKAHTKVVDASLTIELATYKEQVKLYERRAKFELTEREQKIEEQLRIVITDSNIKEENLKKELHSVKMKLNSTINHNKLMVEEVTSLKNDFKQKENKYLEELLDMKALKEKGIQKSLTKEMTEIKEIFEELEAVVDQNAVNRKSDEIERKNLLIENDNLIVDCLSKEVFYIATNSELTVSRFTKMHDAHTVVQARCLELKSELSKLNVKIQNDDHNELVIGFSNLKVNHLNLQLKHQHLKESFGNKKSLPARDALDFNSVFVIKKMKASIQGKDNSIKKLRMQIFQLKETRSETGRTLDFRALDF
nr:replication protein A 70 kDa DNA-binding subunit C-like [Tanacetum cinerariifolium]